MNLLRTNNFCLLECTAVKSTELHSIQFFSYKWSFENQPHMLLSHCAMYCKVRLPNLLLDIHDRRGTQPGSVLLLLLVLQIIPNYSAVIVVLLLVLLLLLHSRLKWIIPVGRSTSQKLFGRNLLQKCDRNFHILLWVSSNSLCWNLNRS